MSNLFDTYYQDLHLEMNNHLGSLHLIHHKQQILNIQLIATQIKDKLKECPKIQNKIDTLSKKIQEGLASDNVGSVIHYLSQFNTDIEDIEDTCREQVSDLVSHIQIYLNLITKESTNFKDHIQFNDLSSLDTIRAYKEIIDPLSNQKRLDILMAIHNTTKRFKELEQELDLQAGHLIYHLNPLKEAKYVTQDAQKNYLLTEKGKTILEAIKHIYDNYL